MDNFFKREEKTATDNQVKASVKTMLGIMQHNKEIELPEDRKEMTKLLKEIAVPAFEKYLINMKHTWTSADTSAIMSMSKRGWDVGKYEYKQGADIPKGIKEILVIALGSKSEIETELAKEAPKAKAPKASKAKAPKATKAAKAAMTIQAKEKPVDAKPVSWKPVIDDDMLELAAKEGLSESGLAMLLHAAAKANS